ncbi:metallophosphoesterase [Verrucomicrobium spinosum]|uniref:metallophosphoesterase n=1 Tax=Verrucomicrobium spinosum TaxID=2736 RepID=UPI000946672D|nr:metallophosphoesterase [Verrucomicrobium spinosum]
MWLDSRGALWHPGSRWLAVADLHYGYELTMRRAGGLFPQWGMGDIRTRLQALIRHYQPEKLILAGDIMDSSGSAEETLTLLAALQPQVPHLICLEGNHERPALLKRWTFHRWHREDGDYLFHHGHNPQEVLDCPKATADAALQITGHWHPAVTLNDGAGTSMKLPALIQQKSPKRRSQSSNTPLDHWILPAFSPWARGGRLPAPGEKVRQEIWACHQRRVFAVG